MIRSLYYIPGEPLRTGLEPGDFIELLKAPESLLWVDFVSEPPQACEPLLQKFGFHPLAIDDALEETHTPKVDDWGDYLYIVLNAMNINGGQQDGLQTVINELDIFLGHNYVITHHDDPLPAIDDAWEACQRDPRHTQNGPDHLLYKIIDLLVAAYMPLVGKIDQAIDQIEDQVFTDPRPHTLEQLFDLKRILLTMRRIITPQREVLNKLARDDYTVIDPKDRIFFRDVYDHLVRLHDLNESMRDLVGGALDTYLSVINNRMNEVMKTLTVITTLFMPITFVTGFFGMNFFEPVAHLVGWTGARAFLVMLGIVSLLPIGMYLWMRRRLWV
jgi:magnesium transporter